MLKAFTITALCLTINAAESGCSSLVSCGDWNCCSSTSKCGLAQGDCDTDEDCQDGLICGSNNCRQFNGNSHPAADCCTKKGFPVKLTFTTKKAESWCGTNADIYLSLFGSNGETCKTIGLDTTKDDFERGATDVFTNLGDNCKTTAFNNGISKVVVEHKSKNAWCFLNTIIELENGEKYKFENPRKFRKGKENESDWLRNEKREGKPQKLGSGSKSTNAAKTGFPVKITFKTKNGESWCGTNADIYASLTGSNGETCKTIGLDTTADDFERGATDVFTNLGDECKTTAFNNGISKVVVEHSSKDAWCFLNTVIELDSGEKYLFENPNKNRKGKKTESDWLRNEKREGKPVKMSCCFNKPGVPIKVTFTTKAAEKWCGTNADIYVSLIGGNGETCKTKGLDTTADDFERGATDVFTNLGDACKATAFKNGISKVVVEHSSTDAWCFKDTVIELDNGEKYKFVNPEKNRKGKPNQSDWLENEKREGKPEKLSNGATICEEEGL